MFIVWTWGDREIEKPILLKAQLEDIQSKGFSGVLACLGETRYELIDRKVIRAAAQASQWAKRRGISFWFQTDPRQASRSIIAWTEERTQNLLAFREHHGHFHPNMIRVRKNRFVIRIPYPKLKRSHTLQDASLNFEPSGLERAFLLRIEEEKALHHTIRDISSEARFFTNVSERYVEVFGDVDVPSDETWYVLVFPRFDTNAYDYAGRKSVDKLLPFIESLFESGLYLDGISWDRPGYHLGPRRLPVSASLYNAFIAEFGYDLRSRLPALVFDFDDGSHIPVRNDYASILLGAVSGALKEFYGMLHAFFGDVETVMPSGFDVTGDGETEMSDPWQALAISSSGAMEIRPGKPLRERLNANLTTLVQTKSLGVFSKTQRSYALLKGFEFTREGLSWWMDLAALFSVQWLVQEYRAGHSRGRTAFGYPEQPGWEWFADLNRYHDMLARITGFKFPESDTLLVLPFETLVSSNPVRGQEIRSDIEKLISLLVLNGTQLDVVSSAILTKVKVDHQGMHFRNRIYQTLVYPYPEILSPSVLDLIFMLDKLDFPVVLGGAKPRYTTRGESVLHDFPVAFDLKDEAFVQNWQTGAERVFQVPESGLGSVIQTGTETLLLFCPKEPGEPVEGKARYRETVFEIPKSDRLAIYRLKDRKVERML